MANGKQIVMNMAAVMGLKTGKNGTFCHGMHCGYPFLLEEKKDNRQNELKIQMCATKMGQPMTYEMFQELMFPQGVRMYVGNYRLNLSLDAFEDISVVTQKLTTTIAMVTDLLQKYGYTGCDELGGVYNISLYSINGSYSFYSIDNVSYLEQRLEQVKEQERAVKERVPLGILAALGGTLAGAALILIIGKLGYISFYASIFMVVMTIILYRKAAKKFTVVSAVITGIISLAASIIVPRLRAALTIYDSVRDYAYYYSDITVYDCFVNCKAIYDAAGISFYFYRDVVLMTVLGIGTAVVMIVVALRDNAKKDKIQKIS